MNLHVICDTYGLYSFEIANRIKNSFYNDNNIVVNLSLVSKLKDDTIIYIEKSDIEFQKYINSITTNLNKVIFHPYTTTAYHFLKLLLKKFPAIKVYWVCWSGELYKPHVNQKLYNSFSAKYIAQASAINPLKKYIKKIIRTGLYFLAIRKSEIKELKRSYKLVHYFCSLLPSDYDFLCEIKGTNKISFLPFAYLSLNSIMPDLDKFQSRGNKIMIGHSSSPTGNHYEIIQKVSSVNANFPVFLPLVYGDDVYANIIKQEAKKKFTNLEVLEQKLESLLYYEKLTEVGWAIINTNVQEGVGNIMALVWMGAKVFLNKKTSTYKDFISWGLTIFNVETDINNKELTIKLNEDQIKNNRKILFQKLNEEQVAEYWEKFLD